MMKLMKVCVASLLLLFLVSGGVLAQLPPDWREVSLPTSKDSHLPDSDGGRTNKGLTGQSYWWESTGTQLYQWDVSGVTIGADEDIRKIELEIFSSDAGPYRFHAMMTAYPMRDPWQEGVGVPPDGYGGRGYPWGPASIGDATYAWKQVTETGFGNSPFDTWIVGTDGVPWEAAGGLGTTTDCYPRKMMDYFLDVPQASYPDGTSFGLLPFKEEGIKVVEDWIAATLANNGLVLAHENTIPGDYCNLRVASREFQATPQTAPGLYAPRLWITIGPELPIPGDSTDDDEVDGADYTAWADNYLLTTANPSWRMGGWTVGNWTDDGAVDGADYTVWADNYTGSGSTSVPEPASLALIALGACLPLLRRRR